MAKDVAGVFYFDDLEIRIIAQALALLKHNATVCSILPDELKDIEIERIEGLRQQFRAT